MEFKYKTQAEIAAMTDAEREKYAADKRVHEAELATKAAKDEAEKVKEVITADFNILKSDSTKRMDELEALVTASKETKFEGLDIAGRLAKGFADNADKMAGVDRGNSVAFKVPALMTTTTSLTGTGVISYSGNAAILPSA